MNPSPDTSKTINPSLPMQSAHMEQRVRLDALLLGLAVFGWALFGILTRQSGTLASFWPANAFLLAMLVRFPGLATAYAWPAAFLGYVAADIFTGGSLLATGLLTFANLAGVVVGYRLLLRMEIADRRLRRPLAVLFLVLVLAAASAASGLVGAIANPVLFHGDILSGFGWWFVTELVNFIAIVPVILTIPDHPWLLGDRRRLSLPVIEPRRLLPLASLLLSVAVSVFVGGPGAVAFPVPSLLWCAVSYRLFTTSLLTLAFSVWTLLGLANGVLQVATDGSMETISLRLGVMLVALAPLMVASVVEERNRLIEQLRYLAMHDDMTGLKNRLAFFELGKEMLEKARRSKQPSALMMLDIDGFKSINDTFGHQVGDKTLIVFADCLRHCLREKDVCGRIGGEEFAVVLSNCSPEDARTVARRILHDFSERQIDCGQETLRATVSIGVTFCADNDEFEALLSRADKALYCAKQNGRNRAEFSQSAG